MYSNEEDTPTINYKSSIQCFNDYLINLTKFFKLIRNILKPKKENAFSPKNS